MLASRSPLVLFALVAVGCALALPERPELNPLVETSYLSLAVAAVMIAAWYGGFQVGLQVAIVAALLNNLLALSRGGELGASLAQFGVFMLAALVVSTQREARTAVGQAAPAAEYHRLLSDVADAILVADAAGRYLDANRAMADLSGYTPDELAALPAGSLLMPRRPWTAAERERFAHEGHWRGELAVRKKDGQLLPVDARLVILDQPNGPVYLTVIGRRAPLS